MRDAVERLRLIPGQSAAGQIRLRRRLPFEKLDQGDNSDALFVILAFSSGGTRAAALSYGILEALRDTRIQWKGRTKSLLDEVDVISSISGGSFPAAYYALRGARL